MVQSISVRRLLASFLVLHQCERVNTCSVLLFYFLFFIFFYFYFYDFIFIFKNPRHITLDPRPKPKLVGSSKTKVLATESNTFKRRIRKAIEIKLRKPRDNGFELASIYDTILAPSGPLTFLTFKFALWLTKFGGSQRNIPL